MKFLYLISFLFITVSIFTGSQASNISPSDSKKIFNELMKSGLSQDNIKLLLSDCNASQQSMYFCAWRNQLVATIKIEKIITEKEKLLSTCQSKIQLSLTSWEQARDTNCKNSAMEEWGRGSMLTTAKAICTSIETNRMAKKIQTITNCNQWLALIN